MPDASCPPMLPPQPIGFRGNRSYFFAVVIDVAVRLRIGEHQAPLFLEAPDGSVNLWLELGGKLLECGRGP